MSRIYVASSWRNKHQEGIVKLLRGNGHDVYDFKNPNPEDPENHGFGWPQVDENWLNWNPETFRKALKHPVAQKGYRSDKDGVDWCTMGVLVLPSGRSAHLEAGWIGGQGKPVCVYMPELPEPELMYNFFTELAEKRYLGVEAICLNEMELLEFTNSERRRYDKNEIFSVPGCTYSYCPTPDHCKETGCQNLYVTGEPI